MTNQRGSCYLLAIYKPHNIISKTLGAHSVTSIRAERIAVAQKPQVSVISKFRIIEIRCKRFWIIKEVWESNDSWHVWCCAWEEGATKHDFALSHSRFGSRELKNLSILNGLYTKKTKFIKTKSYLIFVPILVF